MRTAHQNQVYEFQTNQKKEWINKQLKAFDGWMNGNMFIGFDGICSKCKDDIIKTEIENGNNGEKGVVHCSKCFKSYCD